MKSMEVRQSPISGNLSMYVGVGESIVDVVRKALQMVAEESRQLSFTFSGMSFVVKAGETEDDVVAKFPKWLQEAYRKVAKMPQATTIRSM